MDRACGYWQDWQRRTAKKDRKHDEAMAEMYREDPAYARQFLNSLLENGDQCELLMTLRQMATAFGGMQTVAEQAHLNPTQFYRTLSPEESCLEQLFRDSQGDGHASGRAAYAHASSACLNR